jgi:hypothetical protein
MMVEFKAGELLGHPEKDNQQPSLHLQEGSTTSRKAYTQVSGSTSVFDI